MSTRISVSTTINAPVHATWASVEELDGHVQWMADARSIRFLSAQRQGVGTEFECLTQIGPIRLTDVMVITDWRPEQAMGVDHRGVVGGTGRFTLGETAAGGTVFSWEEDVTFPWWMGGIVGERAAQPILSRLWHGNLRRLKRQVERTS